MNLWRANWASYLQYRPVGPQINTPFVVCPRPPSWRPSDAVRRQSALAWCYHSITVSYGLEHPEWLALLLIIIPVTAWGWWRLRRVMDSLRLAIVLGLRCIFLAMLVLLLCGPLKRSENEKMTVIGLVDISGSVRQFADLPKNPEAFIRTNLEYLQWWLSESVGELGPDDRLGVVVFAGDAYAVLTPTRRGLERDDSFEFQIREGTDMAEAIRFGLAMFGPDTARRLVLVSDGNETTGLALEAALDAAGLASLEDVSDQPSLNSVPIDVVPIDYDVQREVIVERVEVPAYARPDELVTVRVLIRSTQPTRARLSLLMEGASVDINGDAPGLSRPIQLAAGLNVETMNIRVGEAAVSRFEAVLEPEDGADLLVDNNRGEAFTVTPQRGSVLVVNGVTGRTGATLPNVLEDAGLFVNIVQPGAFPASPVELQAYDLIILQNVAADDLAEQNHDLLAQYVEDLGGGLIMVGGYDSFGAGGWMGTALEDVMPVDMQIPEEMRIPTAAIAIVLDSSGSMDFPVLGTRRTQQEIANEGAAIAIGMLDPLDQISVITFSSGARTVVPIQRVDDPTKILEQVRGISSGGGTNMAPALKRAFTTLRDTDAEIKHVVCLSDGRSQPGDFLGIAADMKANGITLSTIAVGDEADLETMEDMARQGGGEYYFVRDARILPRIFVKDIRIIRRPLIREATFTPRVLASASPIASSLGSPPPLHGLVLTRRRDDPAVQLLMDAPDDHPILAFWQVGLGRAAAFTSDAHEQWARDWIDWPGYRQMWLQLARAISRPAGSREYELLTSIEEDRLEIQLIADQAEDGDREEYLTVPGVVYRPDGEAINVLLRQTGPATYTANIPATLSGNYVVALTPRRGPEQLGLVLGGISQNAGIEFRRLTSNVEYLREISRITGGRTLSLDEPGAGDFFNRRNVPPTISVIPVWPLVLQWCVVLLLIDVAARRIAWSFPGLRSRFSSVRDAVQDATHDRGHQAAATLRTLRDGGEQGTPLVDEAARSARGDRSGDPARAALREASRSGEGQAAPISYREKSADDDEQIATPKKAAEPAEPTEAEIEADRKRALAALKGSKPSKDSSARDDDDDDDADEERSTMSSLLAARRRLRGMDNDDDV